MEMKLCFLTPLTISDGILMEIVVDGNPCCLPMEMFPIRRWKYFCMTHDPPNRPNTIFYWKHMEISYYFHGRTVGNVLRNMFILF